MLIQKLLTVFVFASISLAAKANTATTDYKIHLLSADWCEPCQEIKKQLIDNNSINTIDIKVDGTSLAVPIEIIDFDTASSATKQLYKFKDQGVPQVAVSKNGVALASTFYKKSFEAPGMQTLNPQVGESYSTYYERIGYKKESLEIYSFKWVILNLMGKLPKNSENAQLQKVSFQDSTGQSSILFWGTGTLPFDNPFFSGDVIRKSKETLIHSGVNNNKITVLYGAGDKNNIIPDTMKREGDFPKLVAIEGLSPEGSFTKENLRSYVNHLNKTSQNNAMFVSVGHGAREGFKTWLNADDFTPDMLNKELRYFNGTSVIVSGNCHSGVFAKVGSCGFFAARPETVATGCQEQEMEDYGDYVSAYFESLSKTSLSDFNNDGEISFAEAHWYAVLYGDKRDVPYTKLDYITDNFFSSDKNSELLPDSLVKNDLASLEAFATDGERFALRKLTEAYDNSRDIYLKNTLIAVKVYELDGKIEYKPFQLENIPQYLLIEYDESKVKTMFIPEFISGSNNTEGAAQSYTDVYFTAPFDETSDQWNLNINLGPYGLQQIGNLQELNIQAEKVFPTDPKEQVVLTQLIRRLFYKKISSESPELLIDRGSKIQEINKCESMSILGFLKQ